MDAKTEMALNEALYEMARKWVKGTPYFARAEALSVLTNTKLLLEITLKAKEQETRHWAVRQYAKLQSGGQAVQQEMAWGQLQEADLHAYAKLQSMKYALVPDLIKENGQNLPELMITLAKEQGTCFTELLMGLVYERPQAAEHALLNFAKIKTVPAWSEWQNAAAKNRLFECLYTIHPEYDRQAAEKFLAEADRYQAEIYDAVFNKE